MAMQKVPRSLSIAPSPEDGSSNETKNTSHPINTMDNH